MSKKDRARAAEIRRRLIDDDRDPSPFAGIRLVEKKEEKKPEPKPVARKKPGEIVKGYDPSASFADILYSFEHTGNPYSMPKHKAAVSSGPTDFGAILDKWEGKSAPKKKSAAPQKKSEYRPSRSFADILRDYEGAPEEEARPREKKSNADAQPSAGVYKPSPAYKPSQSFGALLDRFEGRTPPEKEQPAPEKKAEPAAEEPALFRKMEADDEVSSSVAWTIFGGRNEAFVRPEPEPVPEPPKAEEKPAEKAHYQPSKSFEDILSEYESSRERKADAAVKEPEKKESVEEVSFFRRPEGDEKRSETAVWSVFGGNEGFVRNDGALPDFGTALKRFEEKSEEKTFEDYIREKGDNEKKKEVLTISRLRAMPPQSTLDLHGMTVEEADKAVSEFIGECHSHGLRKISIITGKGLHSEDGIGVLRQYVSTLLDASPAVSEKANAPLSAGGAGAFWIILKA